jgi:hypothetical protein
LFALGRPHQQPAPLPALLRPLRHRQQPAPPPALLRPLLRRQQPALLPRQQRAPRTKIATFSFLERLSIYFAIIGQRPHLQPRLLQQQQHANVC